MALTFYTTNRKTGNLVDRKGKIIYYGFESFYNDIIEGNAVSFVAQHLAQNRSAKSMSSRIGL